MSDWVWHGTAGHFVGSLRCCFHLHTTIGEYRVSTVGCYHPGYSDPQCERDPEEIGIGRLYETMVFRNGSDGEPVEWLEIDSDGYNTPEDAERGHMALCWKWAGRNAEDPPKRASIGA